MILFAPVGLGSRVPNSTPGRGIVNDRRCEDREPGLIVHVGHTEAAHIEPDGVRTVDGKKWHAAARRCRISEHPEVIVVGSESVYSSLDSS